MTTETVVTTDAPVTETAPSTTETKSLNNEVLGEIDLDFFSKGNDEDSVAPESTPDKEGEEEPTEAPKIEEEIKPEVSERLLALTKQERLVKVGEDKLKADRVAMEQEYGKYKNIKEEIAKAGKDPQKVFSVFEAIGIDLHGVVSGMAKGEINPELFDFDKKFEAKYGDKIKQLEDELAKERDGVHQYKVQQTIDNIKNNAKTIVASKGFKYIEAEDAYDDILTEIRTDFEAKLEKIGLTLEDGLALDEKERNDMLIPIEIAAERVNTKLKASFDEKAKKLGLHEAPKPVKAPEVSEKVNKVPQTLTNKSSVSQTSKPEEYDREALLKEALKVMNGN